MQFQFITQLTQSPLSLPFGEIRYFMFIFQEFGYEDLQQRDAPRDKRTYFREINYIAAAFQYQKKNYNSA